MKSKFSEIKVKISDTITKWEIEYVEKYTKEINLPSYFGYIVFLLLLLAIYLITGTFLSDIPAIIGWLLFQFLGIKMEEKGFTKVKKTNPIQLNLVSLDKPEPDKTDGKRNWVNDENRRGFLDLCRRLTLKKR